MSNQETFTEFFGTIVYKDLAGGFYGIQSESGDKYNPINLTTDFHRDGLKVHVRGSVKTDIDSYQMWGKVFEILWIKEIR